MERPKDSKDQGDSKASAGIIKRGAQSQIPLRAAIIGGGKACENLITLLSGERVSRLNVEILGVADVNSEAPGVVLAKSMGIFTTDDLTKLYTLPGLNLLIELTGSMAVRERMIRTKPLEVSSIDHRGARLLWDLIQIEEEKRLIQIEAERSIRRERDWCQKVIDSLPDRIMVLNRDYTVHSVNRTFTAETGLRPEDVVGRPCYEVSHRAMTPCSGDMADCPLRQVFDEGKTCSVIHSHQGREGVSYEEIMATPIFDEKGGVIQVIEGIRDVTRRVTLEKELKESEEKLRQFLESAHDIICIKDLGGRYLYLNPQAARSMGLNREDAIGKTDFELFPERLARQMEGHDGEVFAKREMVAFNESLRMEDGGLRYFNTVRFPIRNDKGEMVSLAVIARDMTKELRLQEEVRQNKEYLENVLKNSSDMIITTDLQGRIVTFNPAAERLLGYRAEELAGSMVRDLWIDPSDRDSLMEEVNRRGAVNNYPAVLRAKDGRRVEISLSLSQLKDSRGKVIGTVGISKDVTEENRLRQQLIEQERLAAVGQTVAGVTHCMKNVLNGLKGGAYILNVGLKRGDSAMVIEGWETVQKGIERIGRLSLDMLSYCKDRKPARVRTDPVALAKEIVSVVASSAAQKGVELVLDAGETKSFEMDPDSIGRALLNLLTNAIEACGEKEYTGGERPRVKVSVQRDERGLRYVVADNGIGMSEEILSRLFTRFFSTKEQHGTGLGLCVSEKVVEEHGGKIDVTSSPGKGSTFTIRLPEAAQGSSRGSTSKQ